MKTLTSKYLILFAFGAILFCGSCERSEMDPEMKSNDISLIVSEAREYSTKSYRESIYCDEVTGDVFLEMTSDGIHTGAFNAPATDTKGAPYSEDILGDFHITAFTSEDATNPYINNTEFTSSGSEVNSGYYWPKSPAGISLTFFGHAKNSATDGAITDHEFYVSDKDKSNKYTSVGGSFSYTTPAPDGNNTIAEKQPDVVFAIAPNIAPTTNAVPIKFHHALSALVFKVGFVPANFIVEKVELKNLYMSGDCEYSSDLTDGVTFNWTPTGEKKDFVQTFSKEMSDDDGVIADDQINSDEQTFMMVPQIIGNDAELEITYSIDEAKNSTLSIPLKGICDKWEPGKRYIFRISCDEDVMVDVEDEVSADKSVKSNLSITNTGTVTTYVRAMLYGEWVVISDGDEEVVVAMWDMSKDGVFTNFNTTDWLYSETDGFYYYKYPLAVGAEAADLFNTYELNTVPPVIDAELRLCVASQTVSTTNISSAWGSIVQVNPTTRELSLK